MSVHENLEYQNSTENAIKNMKEFSVKTLFLISILNMNLTEQHLKTKLLKP